MNEQIVFIISILDYQEKNISKIPSLLSFLIGGFVHHVCGSPNDPKYRANLMLPIL